MVFKMYELSRLLMFITISIRGGVFRIFFMNRKRNLKYLSPAQSFKNNNSNPFQVVAMKFWISTWYKSLYKFSTIELQLETHVKKKKRNNIKSIQTTTYLFSNDLGAYASNSNNTKQMRINIRS